MPNYPFGRPVTPRPPSAAGPCPLFVLGAYPSALHVEWLPPDPYKRVQALAVDDEPAPFWNGADQGVRVEGWIRAVGFTVEWGAVRANAKFNGPSGQKLAEHVLRPLGIAPGDAWITDCVDTYCASVGVADRIADTYNPWAKAVGLPAANLAPHPSESMIVRGALRSHRARLSNELRSARSDLIVTLGNAALRVLRSVVGDTDSPDKLAVTGYGAERFLRVWGRAVRWLPLAHPAAPPKYIQAHAEWARSR